MIGGLRLVCIVCHGELMQHMVVDSGMDLEKHQREWSDWYRATYFPPFRDATPNPPNQADSFLGWLRRNGAREAAIGEIEEFWFDGLVAGVQG